MGTGGLIPIRTAPESARLHVINRLPEAQVKMVHRFCTVGGDMEAPRFVAPARSLRAGVDVG
jgi:hypothetical protein